ncbi:MAG: toxic anion resistance protein [Massiliimalia sp.]|jgi:uncharacterized protein YaaN involved in tellurite resistance
MDETMLNTPPSLTLDPFGQEAADKAEQLQTGAEKQVTPVEEVQLTPEEQKIVDDFAEKIDLTNSNLVLQYGAGAQQKIANFSDTALQTVRTKDMGEIGDMISNLVGELKGFDAEEESKGLLGFFKKNTNKLAMLKTKYEKANVNVEKISQSLENHQIQLMKDVALLDKMYQVNLQNFKELSMYILAGKKKLKETRETILPEYIEKAQKSGLPEDSQAANDLAAMCDRFEKKLHDLDLTRIISIQMAPQIRLVQNNDTLMSEKIQSTIVNTIPLWKSQMVIALGLTHSQQAVQAQREVTNLTNELLRKNADALKIATIETAKETERGIVDIETLKHTNESLISTLDEVMQIQAEGHQKRQEAEVELRQIEVDLKNKLLQIRNR